MEPQKSTQTSFRLINRPDGVWMPRLAKKQRTLLARDLLVAVAVVLMGAGLLNGEEKDHQPTGQQIQFQQLSEQATKSRLAGDLTKALELYHQALKLNPRWDEGWWYVGTIDYDSNNYREGVQAFKNLVELDPDYGQAWVLLGLCEFEIHDYKNAFIHLERGRLKGVGNNKELANAARYHEALIDILLRNFDEAKSLLSYLVTQNILTNDVKEAMGLALLHVPLLPGQVDPSKDALIYAAGEIGELEALENFDEADRAFQKLVQNYPQVPFVHFAYGSMLADLSRYPQAEQELKEEIKINPGSSLPYLQLAYIYIRLSRFKDALPLAEQGVKLAPDSFVAHYLAGRSLLGLSDTIRSVQELEIAKRLAPYSPQVRYSLAMALARAKRPREAAAEQAEFRRLQALVAKAESTTGPTSYRMTTPEGGLKVPEGISSEGRPRQ